MSKQYKIQSYDKIYQYHKPIKIKHWLVGLILVVILLFILPWTQNIKSKGFVTSRYQEGRPQFIQTPISGKIEKWYVKEGDIIKKGDTILVLKEIKDQYLDPNLIARTKEQASAKKLSVEYYNEKAQTADIQISALQNIRKQKLNQNLSKQIQLHKKLSSEQAESKAIENELQLKSDQLKRIQKMYEEGLVSQTQKQEREIAFQNVQAKKIVITNKIEQTLQEIQINEIDKNNIEQEYIEKSQKIKGERLSSLGEANTAIADLAKLDNQIANYTLRNGMYIVTAPQDGQVIQVEKSGLGELLKENESICKVIPNETGHYAVEIYVRPVDFPLIETNQKVRLMFDGFPAIVFSGWPKGSFGTFGGKIVAYEQTVNDKGLFKVLVMQDKNEKSWPKEIKIGTGAQSIVLLKTVPIWYEIWRNINGFPPDYYKILENGNKNKS